MKVASASFCSRLLRCKAARAQRHAEGWPAARGFLRLWLARRDMICSTQCEHCPDRAKRSGFINMAGRLWRAD
jgi:hypothetical protein